MPLFPGPALAAALGLIRLSGDFDPSSTAQTPIVGSLSGASPLAITPATLQWLAATTSPTITIAAPTSDVAPTNINLTPQACFAGATVNKTPGSVVVNLLAPISGGNEGYFQVKRSSGASWYLGTYPGSPNSPILWAGTAAPSTTNFIFGGDNTNTTFNAPLSTGQLQFTIANSATFAMVAKLSGVQLGASATNFGGGAGSMLGLTNATSIPTSSPTSAIVLYSNAGALEAYATGFQFHRLVTAPGITHVANTTDVACAILTITPQAPFATATGANRQPGSVIIALAAPTNGGTVEGIFRVSRGGANVFYVQNTASLANSGSLFLGNSVNAQLAYNGGITSIGAVGSVYISPNSVTRVTVTDSGTQLGGNGTTAFGGGALVVGITNATTNPTSNPSGGVVLYGEVSTGHLKTRGSLGGITTLAPAGSAGTINSQAQIYDTQLGTCETVSSSTPTTIFTYTTVSGKAGILLFALVSRATTAGTGIAVGDATMSVYQLGYKNVAGTVTLSTAGITLNGAAQTTAAALTSTLTATAAGAVITVQVTNPALCTIDSQVDMTASVC